MKYVIMLLIAVAVFFAVRAVMKSSKNGGCAGCDGCSGCHKTADGKQKPSCCQGK